MNIKKNKIVSYSYIATEYYDEVSHPTCANFRIASKLIISGFLQSLDIKNLIHILELGAGKSVVAEILEESGINFDSVIISDNDGIMLNYSKNNFDNDKYTYRLLDAENIDLPSTSCDLIVSSLGDPYNSDKFWDEVYRVLKPGGICLYTTPSYDWSSDFRINDSASHFAEFQTKTHELVYVPSYIYETQMQVEILKNHNFSVLDLQEISLKQLKSNSISSKLITGKGDELSIVTGYALKK